MDFPTTLLEPARCLRWIQVTGAGVDAFLAEGTLPDGVILTRSCGSFGEQIADYVLGHLLAIAQRMRDVYRLQATRRWEPLPVDRRRGRVMGIAGTGFLGGAAARAASAIGMQVLGVNRSGSSHDGFERCYRTQQLHRFLERLDVLVVCLPLTASTYGLIGLASMKRSAVPVNVARGAVVDESARIEALRARRLAAAVLDVFAEEPLPAASPVWTWDRAMVTSQHAGLNVPDELIDGFLDNLERFRFGQALHGVVDPIRGY